MRKNTRAGVAGRQTVVAIMAGLLGAAGRGMLSGAMAGLLCLGGMLGPIASGIVAPSVAIASEDTIDIEAYGVRWRLDDQGNLIIGDDNYFQVWTTNAIPDTIPKDRIHTISIGNAGVRAPSDMKYAFANLTSLFIVNLEGLDTSQTTYIGGLFSGCTNLAVADISSLDLNAVNTAAGYTYHDPSELSSLPVYHYMYGFANGSWVDETGKNPFGRTNGGVPRGYGGVPFFDGRGRELLSSGWVDDTVYGNGTGRCGKVFLRWDEPYRFAARWGSSNDPRAMGAVFNNCSSLQVLKTGEGFHSEPLWFDEADLTLKRTYGNCMGSSSGQWINATGNGAEPFNPNEIQTFEFYDWNEKSYWDYNEEDNVCEYYGQYMNAYVQLMHFTEPGTYVRYDSSASYPLLRQPSVGRHTVASSNKPARIVSLENDLAALGLDDVTTRETSTGSGQTSLTMIAMDAYEHGGPGFDPSNPDTDGDGLGDNLAFTVPTSINYVVKANGDLIGPNAGAAYIENRSVFATHVSSLDVNEQSPFSIVASAPAVTTANAVDLAIGPADEQLSAASYLTKAAVTAPAKWQMAAANSGITDQVPLTTSGHVANVSADISSTTKFGEIHWYVTAGAASGSVTEGYPTTDNPWSFGVLFDGDHAYSMGVYYANESWMVYDNDAVSATDAVSDVVATACLSTGAQRISRYKLAGASWVTLSSPVATWTEFMSVSGLSVSEAAGIQSLEVVY